MASKRRLASDINVVPYIDVMLVLLIIFMVTAPLLTTGVQVNLPQAPAEPMDISEENEPLILTVKSNGELYLNIGDNPDQPISADRVEELAARVIEQRPDVPVAVRGDTEGRYGEVVRGMVLLQRAGAGRVGLMTDHAEDGDERG
ncbi:MAG: protein TolR [Salinisphaeraceae bacterium]|uniref:Tol-Pal system protein TolR n=1 Tax=Spectribacter acetivorans TaxID=3075603 RepID=A0ABU3B4N3_9GAMM|nr:protein TolR [Salinisphaera sp. P385]MDT0617412.1 protein TolR [Salinisphaera sp. P385]